MFLRLCVSWAVIIVGVSLYLAVMRRWAPEAFVDHYRSTVTTTSTTSTTDPAETALAQYERDLASRHILRVACYSRPLLARYIGAAKAKALFEPETKHMCGSIQCFNASTCKFVPIVL